MDLPDLPLDAIGDAIDAGECGFRAGVWAAVRHIPAGHVLGYGHVAALNTRALTGVVLQGLLAPLLETVNIINAPLIAKERNIAVSEVTHDRAGDYQTLIRLTVTTEAQSRTVAGTLFAGNRPRIVEIRGISMDAELGPHMLIVTNRDRPGLIGIVGQTLGESGVNIATYNLGRTESGGDAISLIGVDDAVSEDVVKKVRALPDILQAKALAF